MRWSIQLCPEWLEMLWWPLLHQLHPSQHSAMRKRLISDFRSRLSPKTVEELMCLQDWFRASGSTKFSMESIDRCLLDESNEL